MDLSLLIPFMQKMAEEEAISEAKAKEIKKDVLSFAKSCNEKKAFSLWDKLLMKQSSAYVRDIEFKDLSKEMKDNVSRFVDCKSNTKLSFYGMVVKELLDKVDIENYKSAKEHIKDKKITKEEVLARIPDKYVIVMRDKVCDGTHFLSKAEKAGVTSSLNVLDITPALYQK